MSEGAEKTTQDGPKTPKGPPKAPKMTLKGSKNDPKMTPKAQKTRPQSRRRNQLAPRRPKDFQCKIHLGAVGFSARSPVRSCVQCWAGLVGFALAYPPPLRGRRAESPGQVLAKFSAQLLAQLLASCLWMLLPSFFPSFCRFCTPPKVLPGAPASHQPTSKSCRRCFF